MFDPTKPVQTRDGRAAVVLELSSKRMEGPYVMPIRAKVEHPSEPGKWLSWNYMADGRWKSNGGFNDTNDLINFVVN